MKKRRHYGRREDSSPMDRNYGRMHGNSHYDNSDGYMMRRRDGMPTRNYSAMTMGEGYYAGPDPRQRESLEDSRMIHEDHRAIANLPQDVKYHMWPHATYAQYPNLDDSAIGIDQQITFDHDKMERGQRGHKY